jgi:hypothetical protein
MNIIRDMISYRQDGNYRILMITKNQPEMIVMDVSSNTLINDMPRLINQYIDDKDVIEFVLILS